MTVPSVADFDEYSDKYMCCCGCMHVQMGAKIICGLGVVGILLSIIGLIIGGRSVVFAAIGMALSILSIVCLILAIVTEKPLLLFPYFILLMLNIAANLGLGIFVLINSSSVSGSGFVVITIVVCAIMVFLDAWFAFVIDNYYKFLRDKNAAAPRVYYSS